MAESASEHIRVSEKSKKRLRQRKQGEESFDDVIERLLDEDRDLLAGFGAAQERSETRGDCRAAQGTVTHESVRNNLNVDGYRDNLDGE